MVPSTNVARVRPAVIGRLSLSVIYHALRGFSPGTLVLPSHEKPTFDIL